MQWMVVFTRYYRRTYYYKHHKIAFIEASFEWRTLNDQFVCFGTSLFLTQLKIFVHFQVFMNEFEHVSDQMG